jgi:GNAT superfamily N-acetyltransferase
MLSQTTLRSLSNSLLDNLYYRVILVDVVSNRDRADEMLRSYFDHAARQAADAGKLVLCDPPDIGAALWSIPVDPAIAASARSARLAAIEGLLGPIGLANYKKIVGFVSEATAPYVKDDWWYLSITGVAPSAQGKGCRSRLLAPTLAEADAQGAICWLETFTSRDHAFYERLGFKTVATIFEPCTGHDYAVMVR